jgi:DNA-binding GntR family transcriptional regulator
MIRVRMAQSRPLVYVHSYISWTVAAKLSPRSLLKLPLSSAIESGLRIRITDVKHLVGAKLVDAVISAHWQIPAGSPVLFVERNYFCKKICLRTMGFYRTDLFRYELKLKRGRAKPT